ncbi:MAG: putative permease [Bacillota bacterium]|jgi:drug/metabolite transporter (DMT)-like permease|nr:putative permease [Bacillota bacterium]
MNKLKLITVMVIWGSIGVFARSIPLSALSLAFLRALIALPILFVVMKIKRPDRKPWNQFLPYIFSGVLLGFGWLTLFYGFQHTSISSAVIIYNMCPVYVMILAPMVLKERITRMQAAVICISFLGLFLIVGQNSSEGYGTMGMALSAVSGMLYAAIVLINRSIKVRVDNHTATFVQILAAMLILLPFVLMEGSLFNGTTLDARGVTYTVLLGVLHTGVAYTLFFSLCAHMKSVEIVPYSFLEPLFGILFSVLLLGEILTLPQIAGGILILGSNFVGERWKSKAASAAEAGTDLSAPSTADSDQ